MLTQTISNWRQNLQPKKYVPKKSTSDLELNNELKFRCWNPKRTSKFLQFKPLCSLFSVWSSKSPLQFERKRTRPSESLLVLKESSQQITTTANSRLQMPVSASIETTSCKVKAAAKRSVISIHSLFSFPFFC